MGERMDKKIKDINWSITDVIKRMRDNCIVGQGPLFRGDDDKAKSKWKWLRPKEKK